MVDDMKSKMQRRSTGKANVTLQRLVHQAARNETAEVDTTVWMKLDQIIIDPRIQVRRRGLNPDTVESYFIAMQEDGYDSFPPVVVFRDGNDFWLGAGFHRFEAAYRAELPEIRAEVRPGGFSAAYWFALTDNLTNGLPLSGEDKKEALKRLMGLGDEPLPPDQVVPSKRELGRILKVSHPTISAWLEEMEKSTGKNLPVESIGADGKRRNTSQIGDANRRTGQRGDRQKKAASTASTQHVDDYSSSGYEERYVEPSQDEYFGDYPFETGPDDDSRVVIRGDDASYADENPPRDFNSLTERARQIAIQQQRQRSPTFAAIADELQTARDLLTPDSLVDLSAHDRALLREQIASLITLLTPNAIDETKFIFSEAANLPLRPADWRGATGADFQEVQELKRRALARIGDLDEFLKTLR